MAENFININRNTPMLLPPDLRDWVEENDLVHFILEVVAEIPDHQSVSIQRRSSVIWRNMPRANSV